MILASGIPGSGFMGLLSARAGALLAQAASAPDAERVLKQLKGISGIEKSPQSPKEWTLVPWVVAAGFLALFVFLVRFWIRHRRKPAAKLAPTALAEMELARLESFDDSSPDKVRQFFTSLSGVVRRYLEMEYQLRPTSQTTPEFLATLAQASFFPPRYQAAIQSFLDRCDLAKFARADFSHSQCCQTLELARSLIRREDWSSVERPESAALLGDCQGGPPGLGPPTEVGRLG
jgi:hypothetical protein